MDLGGVGGQLAPSEFLTLFLEPKISLQAEEKVNQLMCDGYRCGEHSR